MNRKFKVIYTVTLACEVNSTSESSEQLLMHSIDQVVESMCSAIEHTLPNQSESVKCGITKEVFANLQNKKKERYNTEAKAK